MLRNNDRTTRRTALKGIGAALALPWLEATAHAAPEASSAEPGQGQRRRMVAFTFPLGAHPWTFFPRQTGRNFELPEVLTPLRDLRDQIVIFNQLYHAAAIRNGGAHVRTLGCFFTGATCNHQLSSRAQARVGGPSFDQAAARIVGNRTRIPSLALATDAPSYIEPMCAYGDNVSWVSPTEPAERLYQPLAVYHRLFGIGDDQRLRRELARDRGLLDSVLDDANRFRSHLGVNDRQRLDEYLESVRSVERRIAADLNPPAASRPPAVPAGVQVPSPQFIAEKRQRDRLMLELLVLALQTDSTRIITFSLGTDPHPGVSIPGFMNHHAASHHGHNLDRVRAYNQLTRYCVENYAWLVDRLRSLREGENTLLDQSMVLLASNMGDGDSHHFRNLPLIVAGKGGGAVETGRFVACPRDTPLSNLFLGMMHGIGARAERFADSTEPLRWLTSNPPNMPAEPNIDNTTDRVRQLYFAPQPPADG